MKKLVLIVALAMLAIAPAAAQRAQQLLDAAFDNYQKQNYATTCKLAEQAVQALDTAQQPEADSLRVRANWLMSKSYYRDKKPAQAAQAIDRAIGIMAKNGQMNDLNYAFYLDNSSMYHASARDYETAVKRSAQAIQALGKFPDMAVSSDMATTLFHQAENYYYTKKTADAIAAERSALDVMEKLKGLHSKEYIGELPYLEMYYRALGDERNANATSALADTLQKELDNGIADIPDPSARDLTKPEVCHQYAYEAYRCACYYLEQRVGQC